jgi:predicted  nucleic acid-binding Zn-ribbon protein|tara:strand:- start:15 stop:359 length:345 start_codon:yes stop_codon:yes gene_type:complete
MAKTKKQKEEVADLAEIVNDTKISEKPEKIDEQELAQLQSSVKTVDQLTHEVGTIEVRKHALMKAMEQVQTRIEGIRVQLNTKYGTDNISIQDGTITYPDPTTQPENGEADKKN